MHGLRSGRSGELKNRRPVRVNSTSGPAAKNIRHSYLLFRPQNTLVFFRDWSQTFVNEFLQALPAVGFGRVDVALRIRSNAMHGVELTWLPASVAETR